MKKASYIANLIGFILCLVGAFWLFASIWEVASNNMTPGYVYHAWNLFELLF